MTGDITINGLDAYRRWGISLTDGARVELMTPPPAKDYITNDSPLEDGQQYVTDPPPRTDARDLQLALHFTARSVTEFLQRYADFCQLLEGRVIDLTDNATHTTYHLVYRSVQQYSAYLGGIAKFVLKVTEPNPADRAQH